ncbi:MAG: ThiF family adenylyltransferase [Dehalococcoidia bacterium]|jgi:adenylyltransferase/sulfurtransferase
METERNSRQRYSRQVMFHGIGEEGQEKLKWSNVLIVGCGALGSNVANLLVRAGAGKVRIVDRDFIEFHNLQRQVLFEENDIKDRLPKAVAAKRRLNAINSLVDIEAIVSDINYSNAEKLCSGMDVILDGLDNLETRYLINDVALKLGIPYVYGGAVSSLGMTMNVIPGRTPCLRCVFPDMPPEGIMPTCETDGVLGTAAAAISSFVATEAIKILVGSDQLNEDLISLDVWDISFQRLPIARKEGCPACNGSYEFLKEKRTLLKSSLCGQSRAIQIVDTSAREIVLEQLAGRLSGVQNLTYNEYMLSFDADNCQITVFPDGRAIIRNTLNDELAEKIYDRYVRKLQT